MKIDNLNENKHIFVGTLGFALGVRQMAMTMVMPFLSTYSKTLKYNTPILSGMSLGIFGLMQAIFQIPYGIWSDKKGNKIVMVTGLFQVILGLIIAYFATNIYILIFARALQGSGAIIAVGYSWISSVSENSKERNNNLAIISIIVGVAASSSFAFGPLIHRFVSLSNMFLYSALLIFLSWLVIVFLLKDSDSRTKLSITSETTSNFEKADKTISLVEDSVNNKAVIGILIRDKSFVTLNLAGFINNFIMTGVFYTVPQYLEQITGIDYMWKVFMPAVLIAVFIMKTSIKRLNNIKSIKFLMVSFIICAVGMCFFFYKFSFLAIFVGTTLFMIGYISISTIIPSLGNVILKDEYRGTGNGIINSFQYIGSFVGSIIIAVVWAKSEMLVFIILGFVGILGGIMVKINVKGDKFNEK